MAAALNLPSVLPPELQRALAASPAFNTAGRVISTGLDSLDSALPDQGFPRASVIEIAAHPGLGQASSVALRICAAAQHEARLRSGSPCWCAWFDPACSLYAPGVVSHQIELSRLLVIRPSLDALARLAVRAVTSRVFSVVVIDTMGVPGAGVAVPLNRWPNVVRRLALAAQGGDTSVVLLTHQQQSTVAALPVALRLEVNQREDHVLGLRVAKERRGRMQPQWRELAYTRPEPIMPLTGTCA